MDWDQLKRDLRVYLPFVVAAFAFLEISARVDGDASDTPVWGLMLAICLLALGMARARNRTGRLTRRQRREGVTRSPG